MIRFAQQEFVAAYPLADLREFPGNPRRGDIPAIAESIQANGFYKPLVVQRSTRFIIAGNHRMVAARACGYTELPAWVVECDDVTARKILLLDNAVADAGSYDPALEQALVAACDAAEGGLVGTGYTPQDLQRLTDRIIGAVDQRGELNRSIWVVIATLPDGEKRAALQHELASRGYKCKPLR